MARTYDDVRVFPGGTYQNMQWLPLSITLNDRYDLLMLFLVGHFDNVL